MKIFALALLLANASALEIAKMNRQRKYTISEADQDIDKFEQRYSDASDGILKTEEEYAEDAEKLKPSNIYKPIRSIYKNQDDKEYATTHRCFGEKCPLENKSDKYAMREFHLPKNLKTTFAARAEHQREHRIKAEDHKVTQAMHEYYHKLRVEA